MPKIDCEGEHCFGCNRMPSCLRLSLQNSDGELVDYVDLCWVCAGKAADATNMPEVNSDPRRLRVYHERMLRRQQNT